MPGGQGPSPRPWRIALAAVGSATPLAVCLVILGGDFRILAVGFSLTLLATLGWRVSWPFLISYMAMWLVFVALAVMSWSREPGPLLLVFLFAFIWAPYLLGIPLWEFLLRTETRGIPTRDQ